MSKIDELIYSLNSIARSGWMIKGIEPCKAETVSQHLFASSLIALEISSKLNNVDKYKAASIALIHDIGEAIIGDISKTANIDKSKSEKDAINSLDINNEIKKLYYEFESSNTIEGIIAKISDLLSTYIISLKYEREGYNVNSIKDNVKEEIINLSKKYNLENIIIDFLKGLDKTNK
ncbi:putative HD superfamily hydrolase [Caldisphaera lagunensis DSM 15908]|uniref:5'-deoxynucleotidase n=1 Tax=Caldisphaera lagunensis (strain DSM 15908 / JCM 11604 / ANMR 0165 / IC-154) TaxID=1056495 RepID=L0A8Q9_CALLD|nr:HD family hydrolase [Caldisphaera lagunensis]AFZ70226.1 putative HD superfamily hydrolase [Caldisphaera lagunensis DSM 15908]